ncbi:hypothetical protein [Streptosporangium sp. NPDC051022]|uniref:hypothetical protein n=1 Tax=Streptosporangium sp. NPDC051022 TaxID=3155752 RepID=UPI00341E5800
MTSPPGGESTRRRPVAVPIAALVAATGLGITAAFGGFSEAPQEPPKQLGPGASLDQGEFTTKFVESRTVFQPDQFGGEGKRFLEVELQVTNKGDETTGVGFPRYGKTSGVFFAASLLKMTPAIADESGPTVSVPGRSVPSRQLHPDLPATVVLRYELEPRQHAPKQVQYDVGTFEFSAGAIKNVKRDWLLVKDGDEADSPPKVVAQVTLPVRQAGNLPARQAGNL